MASILSVELSAQPSSLLLKKSLIMIHEVCLLLKYNTMEISIFNASMTFGPPLTIQPTQFGGEEAGAVDTSILWSEF